MLSDLLWGNYSLIYRCFTIDQPYNKHVLRNHQFTTTGVNEPGSIAVYLGTKGWYHKNEWIFIKNLRNPYKFLFAPVCEYNKYKELSN